LYARRLRAGRTDILGLFPPIADNGNFPGRLIGFTNITQHMNVNF